MATKAELEQELADLRRQMNARQEPEASDSAPEPDESAAPEDAGKSSGNDLLDRLLKEQGLASEDLGALMEQLNEELGQLPQEKPLLTALGAFGLGFVLGRMSR